MKLVIESTSILTVLRGVPVRLWHGQTESGQLCKLLVAAIAATPESALELEAELTALVTPSESIDQANALAARAAVTGMTAALNAAVEPRLAAGARVDRLVERVLRLRQQLREERKDG